MPSSLVLTYGFAALLVSGLVVRFWLASRQIRHVATTVARFPHLLTSR